MSTHPLTRPKRTTINDIKFLISHNVGMSEAASRLGFPTAKALQRWLHNHSRHDLARQLGARDWLPVGDTRPMRGDPARYQADTERRAS